MIGYPQEVINWLFSQDKDKLYEIKEYKEKRSLTANNYSWALLSKIADAMRISKDECYLMMLKRYGQSEIVTVLSSIDITHYFKYYEPLATATLQDKEFTHYKVFLGSSEYNTHEMAVFIDGIISEAQALNIDTLPPKEVERLKVLWNNGK